MALSDDETRKALAAAEARVAVLVGLAEKWENERGHADNTGLLNQLVGRCARELREALAAAVPQPPREPCKHGVSSYRFVCDDCGHVHPHELTQRLVAELQRSLEGPAVPQGEKLDGFGNPRCIAPDCGGACLDKLAGPAVPPPPRDVVCPHCKTTFRVSHACFVAGERLQDTAPGMTAAEYHSPEYDAMLLHAERIEGPAVPQSEPIVGAAPDPDYPHGREGEPTPAPQRSLKDEESDEIAELEAAGRAAGWRNPPFVREAPPAGEPTPDPWELLRRCVKYARERQIEAMLDAARPAPAPRRDERRGQWLFNLAEKALPDITPTLVGTTDDCFFDDTKCAAFLRALVRAAAPTEREQPAAPPKRDLGETGRWSFKNGWVVCEPRGATECGISMEKVHELAGIPQPTDEAAVRADEREAIAAWLDLEIRASWSTDDERVVMRRLRGIIQAFVARERPADTGKKTMR